MQYKFLNFFCFIIILMLDYQKIFFKTIARVKNLILLINSVISLGVKRQTERLLG